MQLRTIILRRITLQQTIKVNNKEIHVSFTNYYDSVLGEFLFTQVMCDVFMPGNEAVPIDLEKQQIRRIIDGFAKRKELSIELSKMVKGKYYFVINPRMRYDLGWLEGKKENKRLSNDPQAKADAATAVIPTPPTQNPEPEKREYTDNRRRFLVSKGFTHNKTTNNWELYGIRFPDSKIDNSQPDEEFYTGMNSLIAADNQNREKRKPKSR
jgi:hypothetical protein